MHCPACDHENIPGEDLCLGCGMDLAGLDVTAWGVSPQDRVLQTALAALPLKTPIVLGPDASVSEAIDLMRQRKEGCVFVCGAGSELIGVLTERDVTVRIAAPGRDPARTRLHEVMTRDPVTLQEDDALAWGLHRMGVDGYRHLPVLDGERLVGFLSVRTVLRTLLGR